MREWSVSKIYTPEGGFTFFCERCRGNSTSNYANQLSWTIKLLDVILLDWQRHLLDLYVNRTFVCGNVQSGFFLLFLKKQNFKFCFKKSGHCSSETASSFGKRKWTCDLWAVALWDRVRGRLISWKFFLTQTYISLLSPPLSRLELNRSSTQFNDSRRMNLIWYRSWT